MKTKPIRRNENLVPISREHHATLLFCWKLRQGVKMEVAPQRIALYVAWFWKNHLEEHFASEENVLFKGTEHAMIDKALHEHAEIYNKVTEMGSLEGEDLYKAVLQLADLVDHHTRYEERELFPWIENTLSETSLNAIGKELLHEEHSAKEDYSDEFWVKEK